MFHNTIRRATARHALSIGAACLETLEGRRLLAGYQVEALDLVHSQGDLMGGDLANNGTVVGLRDGPGGREVVVRRKSGEVETVPVSQPAQGTDVTESGDVVGYYSPAGASGRRAFHYSNGVVTDLPGFEGSTQTEANAINSPGDVAGASRQPGGFQRAVIWRDGVPEFLGTLGGRHSIANDINNDGQVVGESAPTGQNLPHAFLYQNGEMRDLGVLNTQPSFFTVSNALAINNDGTVVGGSSSDRQGLEAFLWADGTMTSLGNLPGGRYSLARDINDNGVVVGEANSATSFLSAFVWTAENGMVDLNSFIPGAGVHLTTAINVNNKGQILAAGQDNRLYLLTPGEDAQLATLPPADEADAAGDTEDEDSVFGNTSELLLA